MSHLSWMPLYIGDYRADTTHLNAAQHGAYLLLIMHYWQHGGLPDDDEQLARIACMTASEWRRNRQILRPFFGEGWRHARIDEEKVRAVAKYEKRSRAGKKGNSKRWDSASQCDRNAMPMRSQPQPQPHSLRESIIQGEQHTYQGNLAMDGVRLSVINGGAVSGGDEL